MLHESALMPPVMRSRPIFVRMKNQFIPLVQPHVIAMPKVILGVDLQPQQVAVGIGERVGFEDAYLTSLGCDQPLFAQLGQSP